MPRYFIRNDDVGARTPALERFVETFLRAELPVSYQVIPLKLTDDCARWLSGLRAQHPQLIEFGQHGLRHEMMVRGKRVWREFGPERDYDAQFSDIQLGKHLLEDALGPISIFTPPQHKYDRNTLRAAAHAGLEILSAAHYTPLPYRLAYAAGRAMGLSSIRHHGLSRHGRMRNDAALLELSISIAIDNGGTLTAPPAQLSAQLENAAYLTNVVGVMMHHEVFTTQSDILTQIADVLANKGKRRFATLTSLANRIKAADNRCSPLAPAHTMSWG